MKLSMKLFIPLLVAAEECEKFEEKFQKVFNGKKFNEFKQEYEAVSEIDPLAKRHVQQKFATEKKQRWCCLIPIW